MPLQFRRGLEADREDITPAAGEPIYTTDDKKLYIGDGTTAGGVLVSGTVDGSGTTNTVAYWVDADTLGSLATTTYPTLTELSYIKGLTSAIQTQLNGKEPTITAGTTSQYWRGDKTWQTLNKSAVGLGNVDNTSDADKPISTATQTALDGKVDENSPITGATKTKITYDSKGLVTAGADATTADIADSTNKRYVTDSDLTKLSNLSGTNTGDQTITLSGAVTGSGTGAITTTLASNIDATKIADGSVTSTEFQYLSNVTSDIQTQLDGKVDENSAITGATKTKITYDSKGLVTAGADATTADISDSTNKRYVTDADLTKLSNLSGTNTGDQTITLTGDVTGTGTGSFATTIANGVVGTAKLGGDITTAGKALLDDADASAQRTTLGLGTIATQNADNVNISGAITGGWESFKLAQEETPYFLTIAPDGAGFTANRQLNLSTGNANRTLTISGDSTISGTNTGDQNIFSTIAVSGQSNVVADSTSDTLTLVAGSNVTITTDASTDSITISSTGGGGIDGSGASNKLTIWSDADSLTYDTQLHWDTTNDRLGIKTTSPNTSLQVAGGTHVTKELAAGLFNWEGDSKEGRIMMSGSTAEMSIFDRDLTSLPGSSVAGNRFVLYNKTKLFRVYTEVNEDIVTLSETGSLGLGIGSSTASARLHAISTTEQMRLGYDTSNYVSTTVSSTGVVTLNAVGSGASFIFQDPTFTAIPTTTTAASGTLTIDVANTEFAERTALTATTTIETTGTAVNGQKLIIRLKDDGTSRSLSWNAIFVSGGPTLPTATTAGKWTHLGFIYNSTNSKWMLVASTTEA